jgi:hypothetical protein
MNNGDAVILGNVDVPAIADDQLIAIADQAEKRIEAVKKIKALVFRVTNQHDWIDQQGKPYLWASGAEKVARMFGISWRIDEPVYEPLEAGHYQYTYKGYFGLGGITIEAIGIRSSKDGFFKKYSQKDADGNREELPSSEIDKGDVKKSAYTNCIGNGITRLLGIRNMTWDELRAAGITKEKSDRVEYGSSKTDRTGKISDAQRKRFYAIAKGKGKSDDIIKEYLKNTVGVETSADIPADRYDETCKWAETTREPGEEG